ncbi:hypothetical protein K2X40_05530 [Candidatus Babeliales bacterium]|nr:hypothetical protein [Candidatus Babeliales bacterium]
MNLKKLVRCLALAVVCCAGIGFVQAKSAWHRFEKKPKQQRVLLTVDDLFSKWLTVSNFNAKRAYTEYFSGANYAKIQRFFTKLEKALPTLTQTQIDNITQRLFTNVFVKNRCLATPPGTFMFAGTQYNADKLVDAITTVLANAEVVSDDRLTTITRFLDDQRKAGLQKVIDDAQAVVAQKEAALAALQETDDQEAQEAALHDRDDARQALADAQRVRDVFGIWLLFKQTGFNTFQSPAGLVYGPDMNFGNRIYHVLNHTKAISNKPKHNLFSFSNDKLFAMIDRAWLNKEKALVADRGEYIIEMNELLGTNDETAIKIVVKPDTADLITAFPIGKEDVVAEQERNRQKNENAQEVEQVNAAWPLLKLIGKDTWESPAGLVYRSSCIKEIIDRTVADPENTKRSVFSVPQDRLFEIIDRAWASKQTAVAPGRREYAIDMKEPVGTKGETAIKIMVKPGTVEVSIAFPVKL